jgi:hypothetical protein
MGQRRKIAMTFDVSTAVDWTDMSEVEEVAKAIRDTAWRFHEPAPSQAYIDTLPLTPCNLACGAAALARIDQLRSQQAILR